MTTNAQLATQVSNVLLRWNSQLDQLAAWLAGDPSGGPNLDGKYPLTNAEGTTENFLSLPSVLDLVEGPAALAGSHRDAAEAAAILAGQHKADAQSALTGATGAQAAALVSRDQAQTLRDDVAARWAAVQSWASQVSNDALAVANASAEALTARDESLLNADNALAARVGAEEARDAAYGYAISIDPAQFATLAAVDDRIEALVGQAPVTMDTLNELAAALGDDPYFATTMTNALAGKAPLVHGHVIADVAGLQTALDGKQPVGSYASASHTHSIAQVSGLQAALDAKQASLGFSPVQQGGGTGQLPSKLYIGWNGSSLAVQVDASNFGSIWPISISGGAPWSNISGKPSAFPPSGHGHSTDDVSGLNEALIGKMGRGTSQWLTTSEGRNRFFFAENGRTYFGSGYGFEWRSPSDGEIMRLDPSGDLTVYGQSSYLRSSSPTLWWHDTDHRTFGIHVNADIAYFMRGGTNSTSWTTLANGQWPMTLNLNDGSLNLGGPLIASDLITGRSSGATDVNSANDMGSLSVRGGPSTVAAISFHRTNSSAINMGLGTDDVFRIGGWSAVADAFKLDGSGNLGTAGVIREAGRRVLSLADTSRFGGVVTISAASPSGGNSGDIWLKV